MSSQKNLTILQKTMKTDDDVLASEIHWIETFWPDDRKGGKERLLSWLRELQGHRKRQEEELHKFLSERDAEGHR